MLELSHEALLFGIGAVILLVVWLPLLLRRLPLSLPIIGLAAGVGLSFTPWLAVTPSALAHDRTAERLTEIVVLVALMGAGLRLDRPLSLRRWDTTWRLLGVAMPLTMIMIFAAAHWVVGLSIPAALLLAGVLAPTDPVLAADVQSGPPKSGDGGETRFGLTSEAGLNDGLAFPFILLAIALQIDAPDFLRWFAIQFLGELVLGVAIGWGFGWVSGYVIFRLPAARLSDTGDGLIAIGVTLLTYAVTMALHGNGFIAVFVAALTIRSICPDDEFHIAMAAFASQVERVLLMLVLLVFGWAVGRGLLASLTWKDAAISFAVLLIFRPVAAWAAFRGAALSVLSRRLMAFFGIRGVGTIFYLQYAFNRTPFAERKEIWAIAGFAILGSILLHGFTSTPLMTWADRRRAQKKDGDIGEAVAEAGENE